MTPLDIDTVLAWRGRTVLGSDGEKLGTLGEVLLDAETDTPAWGGVRSGFLGRQESYMPLGAVEERDGDLVVPYTSEQVSGAPTIDPEVALTGDEERLLFEHYGEQHTMIRSEEEVEVSEGPMVPKERVRLRKVLVTHEEERTVPVRKEVIQLETEPPPAGRVESVEDV